MCLALGAIMTGLRRGSHRHRLMALRSTAVVLSTVSALLWPSPTSRHASGRLSASDLIPTLILAVAGNVRGSPQLHPLALETCRRLSHRRSRGCTFPSTSPRVSGFAHRTGARLPGSPRLCQQSPPRYPLRCSRSFVILRPVPSPCRSDWLRVPRSSDGRRPAIGCSPFPGSALGTGHNPPWSARFPSRDVVTGLRFSALRRMTPVRLPARNGTLAGPARCSRLANGAFLGTRSMRVKRWRSRVMVMPPGQGEGARDNHRMEP